MIARKMAQRDLHGNVTVIKIGADAADLAKTEELAVMESLAAEDSLILAPQAGAAPKRITYAKVLEALNKEINPSGLKEHIVNKSLHITEEEREKWDEAAENSLSAEDAAAVEQLQLHAWRIWKTQGYSYGEMHYVQLAYATSASDCKMTVYYNASGGIACKQSDQTLKIMEPTAVTVNYNNPSSMDVLKGHYWSLSEDYTQSIYYSPKDATYESGRSSGISSNYAYIRMEAKTVFYRCQMTAPDEVVTAESKDAYPLSGTKNGWTYEYLGTPLENAGSALKYASGTYIGTGAYGEDAPNELVFDFLPKIVIIDGLTVFLRGKTEGETAFSHIAGGHYVATWSATALKWYATLTAWDNSTNFVSLDGRPELYEYRAKVQLNETGVEYHYVAFG